MIAERFETFLVDLDGVVYVGSEACSGAVRSLRRLRERGKTLRFLTNDPRPTRQELAGRLRDLGVDAAIPEIVTCGSATARYLKREGVEKAYVVGTDGLRCEIESVGVRLENEEDVDAVIVGCGEKVAYPHIRHAALQVRRGAQCVATNNDPTFPTPEGPAPATGAVVSAVRTASGEEPTVIGKPEPPMFRVALDGLDLDRAVMIGDSPVPDIGGAKRAGIAAVLISPEDASGLGHDSGSREAEPDAVIGSLVSLFDDEVDAW